jgi:hypothetical protein
MPYQRQLPVREMLRLMGYIRGAHPSYFMIACLLSEQEIETVWNYE